MGESVATKTVTQPINLRINPEARDLIDRAASLKGTNRSAFMIEAAVAAAQDAVLDQTFLQVDWATYDHMLELFDNPPPAEGLARLKRVKAPWLE